MNFTRPYRIGEHSLLCRSQQHGGERVIETVAGSQNSSADLAGTGQRANELNGSPPQDRTPNILVRQRVSRGILRACAKPVKQLGSESSWPPRRSSPIVVWPAPGLTGSPQTPTPAKS